MLNYLKYSFWFGASSSYSELDVYCVVYWVYNSGSDD